MINEDTLMKNQNMIYALKNNLLVHISEVESGLSCNCTCPACGEELVARKGSKVMHHFAHKSTLNCEFGYQTSLHLAAKDIIARNQKFSVPELYLSFPNSDKRELLQSALTLTVNEVILERKLDTIIPDILLETDIGKIIVEIYVTHEIDIEKKKKIKKIGIPTIEINLSKFDRDITSIELQNILVHNDEYKTWIYNSKREETYKKYLEVSEKKEAICKNHFWNVYNCPIHKRLWNNIVYADFFRDCLDCEFMISYVNHEKSSMQMENIVWCTGSQYINHVQDFDIPLATRIENYNNKKEEKMYDCITQGICPECEHSLTIRNGPYGEFFACTNFPKCKFTFQYKDS